VKLRLVIPGSIDQATGGYRYAKRIVEAWGMPPIAVEEEPARIRHAKGETLLIDGLALPEFYGRLPMADCAALIHHPLGLETGLAPDLAAAMLKAEAHALSKVARIVVTSPATRDDLIRMGVAADKVRIVLPGTATARTPLARRGTATILCVATLTLRKDHPTLLRALAKLRGMKWRAIFVGGLNRDPAQTRKIKALIASLGLGRRVTLAGECDESALARHYAQAHLFALPSLHEGYGMAFAEALAHRLPVVGARAGAVPSVVPKIAGILVRPGDAKGLARALVKLLGPSRRRYAANAARLRFPDWRMQAQALHAALA
jgi:glycosyltransferase involved in cell wall biosynthesis